MKLRRAFIFLLSILIQSIVSSVQSQPDPYKLWTGGVFPKTADIPKLQNVEFRMIKKFQREVDGYGFLHGVALAWHKGKLYASFALNKGGENTAGEEAHWKYSSNAGKTWSDLMLIAKGAEGQSVSHGVFLSYKGKLWAFHSEFTGIMENVHTIAFLFNESSGKWMPMGTAVEGGFWPMQEPQKMKDGNWIMSGARVGGTNPAAVVISHGDDLTKWDLVVIPQNITGNMWGESTVIIEGRKIINIARYGEKAIALVAVSEDYGRTWTASEESNMPMAGSKPYTGILSTGEHYLIGTTTVDGGHRRSPLTIAISRPGENSFSRVFAIRDAVLPGTPCESDPQAALSYPYAIEHDGKLYVGYSNTAGRSGKERIYWNNNSAEMAVIPLDQLK
jgi:hypothetical protein